MYIADSIGMPLFALAKKNPHPAETRNPARAHMAIRIKRFSWLSPTRLQSNSPVRMLLDFTAATHQRSATFVSQGSSAQRYLNPVGSPSHPRPDLRLRQNHRRSPLRPALQFRPPRVSCPTCTNETPTDSKVPGGADNVWRVAYHKAVWRRN